MGPRLAPLVLGFTVCLAGSFSPDGKRFVYTTGAPGRLMLMRADGSEKRPLGGLVGAEPDWR